MTEQDDARAARAAAIAAGCDDVVMAGAVTRGERGFLVPRRTGYLLVSEPFEPGLDLRAVYLGSPSDGMTRRPTLVATVPGTGQVALTSPTAFEAFGRWACTRIEPARLAELLVQQQGPAGASVLVQEGDEAEGLSSELPELHRFTPHQLPGGGWQAGPFTSFTYLRSPDGELCASFIDWDATFSADNAQWQSHPRVRIAVAG
ncbi:hypothetical protein [Actinocrispum sp. NPDC049592]|uniref:hypothetical protein n=1 Tax=Actinocrispum sp. NPDC049592 TaxID=3154835 RepID=UPI00342AD1E6